MTAEADDLTCQASRFSDWRESVFALNNLIGTSGEILVKT